MRFYRIGWFVSLILCFAFANAQSGEGYNLSWWTIDSGGVTFASSAFDVFRHGGTAGQPDASDELSDSLGFFTLRGGFWYRPICFRAFGDIDGNGCVDDSDLLTVLFRFGETGPNIADSNCDGMVDDADLLEVLFAFGSGC